MRSHSGQMEYRLLQSGTVPADPTNANFGLPSP